MLTRPAQRSKYSYLLLVAGVYAAQFTPVPAFSCQEPEVKIGTDADGEEICGMPKKETANPRSPNASSEKSNSENEENKKKGGKDEKGASADQPRGSATSSDGPKPQSSSATGDATPPSRTADEGPRSGDEGPLTIYDPNSPKISRSSAAKQICCDKKKNSDAVKI